MTIQKCITIHVKRFFFKNHMQLRKHLENVEIIQALQNHSTNAIDSEKIRKGTKRVWMLSSVYIYLAYIFPTYVFLFV